MSKENMLTGAEKAFIQANAKKMSIKKICEHLQRSYNTVYAFIDKHDIEFKRAARPKHKGPYRAKQIIHYYNSEQMKKTFTRPPAIYSNNSPFGLAGK